MNRHPTIKERIPNEYSLSSNRQVETKNYGTLSELTLYKGYFYPMVVKSKLKAIFNRLPYKVTIEIDYEKLKKLTENEQSFFKDSIEQTSLEGGYTKEEMNIHRLATQDMIYLF